MSGSPCTACQHLAGADHAAWLDLEGRGVLFIARLGPEGHVLRQNAAAATTFGGFLHRRYTEAIHPEDLAHVEAAAQRVRETGRATNLEARGRVGDGWRWFQLYLHPASGDAGELELVGLDVQERHDALDRLAETEALRDEILDSMDEMFWVVDDPVTAPRLRYLSRSFERVLGVPRQALLEEPALWMRFVHPEDAQPLVEAMARAARDQGEIEVRYRMRIAGDLRWFVTTGRGRRTAQGVRVVGFTREVTAEVEAEEARATVRRLQEEAKARTAFLNAAAHELSTPLTPIRFQLQGLLLDEGRSEEDRQALELLLRNLTRFGTLVQDLLQAARLEAGRLQLDVRPTDVARLASDAVQAFAPKAAADGVTISLEAGPLPPWPLDAARVQQVLFNLLHNALKFTGRGGQVRVALRADGGELRVVVQDTGIGLDAAGLQRLFQPFVQVHAPVAGLGGSGLGLFVSRGIVERHGGALTAASAGRGLGTTFTATFPRQAGGGLAAAGEPVPHAASPARADVAAAPAA
ncbi:MAG TPA: ATP-binding protein [Candidatus Thermoplasmatota archaeon]|nr:ATP-binding protein [Candidatus Thermoplasmatota archaeon]